MTAMDHAQHALGVLCLGGMLAASLYTIGTTVAPQWRRIARLASGQLEAGAGDLPPAASATPHVACIPQRRGVEAVAAPAFQVIR